MIQELEKSRAIIPAICTMLNEDESFSEEDQRKLVSKLLQKQVGGFYVGGSTGEGIMLPTSVRKLLIKTVVDEVNGQVPVIAYIGYLDTKSAVRLAQYAQEVGADGVASVPPYYFSFEWDEVKNYYQSLAEAVDIPLIIYEIPQRTGVSLSLTQIKELFQIPGIKGIKFTSHNHYKMQLIKNSIGKDNLVFSGSDEMLLSGLAVGADGAIGTFYNLIPELFIAIVQSFNNQRMNRASSLMCTANRIISLFLEGGYLFAKLKRSLQLLGVNKPTCKAPLKTMSQSEFDDFRSSLVKLKKLEGLDNVELFQNL